MNILEIYADFETRNNEDNTQGLIDLATITYKDKDNNLISKEFTYLNNDKHIVEQLLDYVVDLKKKSVKNFRKTSTNHIIIYFHNGARYDNMFILDYLLENGFQQRLETKNYSEYENKQFSMLANDTIKILSLVIKYKDCLISIKDSLRKLTYSIGKIGDLLDRPKLTEIGTKFYNKNFYTLTETEQQEYIKYALEDTIIQNLGMEHFTNFLNEAAINNKVRLDKLKSLNHWKNLTLSQAAKDLHKNLDWNESHLYQIPKNEYMNHHYKGGYTMCNPKYINTIVENVKTYDINSSYPSIMLESLPAQIINEEDYHKLKDFQKARLIKVYIISAKLKEGYVPIIRMYRGDKHRLDKHVENNFNYDNEKFFSEVENFYIPFFFWEEEFKYIKEFYELEYEVCEVYYFRKYKIFTRYITHFKNEKEKADKLKQTTTDKNQLQKLEMTRNFAKLSMNCLSGKFGQKIKNENWLATTVPLKKGVYKYDNKIINIIREKEPLSKNSFLYKFALLDNDYTRYINKKLPNNYIISYITAIGRCKLFEIIAKFKHDFVYCDTDSIYCINQTIPEELLDNAEFGKWKFEGEFKYFKCLKPKCYIATNEWDLTKINWKDKNLVKTTLAGFKELTFLPQLKNLEDFKQGLESLENIVKKGKYGGKVWEKRNKRL